MNIYAYICYTESIVWKKMIYQYPNLDIDRTWRSYPKNG